MKKLKTILTIGVIFAMVFTVVPAMTGDMNAYAATPKKITLNVSGYTSYSTALKWNKCKSPKKGYAVFMDGNCIKRFNTKTTSYTVSSSPGAKHSYQIKVWTSKKQYYNTKKKKWVNSKPKASQWKGKQTRYKYTYSKASNTRTVTNPKLNQNICISGSSISTRPNSAFNINAYADSGLAVTYTSSDTNIAVVGKTSGAVITKKAGTATITISQGGNGTYNAAANKTVRINVTGQPQTITCNENIRLDINHSANLSATASSGLPLTYTSENPSIVTVDSTGKVIAKSYGTNGKARIHIEQRGNDTWDYEDKYVYVYVNPADVTIKFDANGGSGTMSNQVLTNGQGTLKNNTFTRTNYTFIGWHTSSSATSPKYTDGATFAQFGDSPITITLYAIWKKNPEPTVVTSPFVISYNNKNNGENVISLNDRQYPVNLTIPEGVKSVTWTKVKYGRTDAKNTIELIPSTNGKTLKIKANNALADGNILWPVKVKAVFVMDDGYIYYDKNGNGTPNEDADRTVEFTVTNTIYPMVGPISDLTYDFKSFNQETFGDHGGEYRRLNVFSELPSNSTVNININEWDAIDRGTVLSLDTNDVELLTPSADLDIIITRSNIPKSMRLVHAGTFKMLGNNRTITFNLTGQNSDMVFYSNHLSSVANACMSNSKYNTAMNCLAYVLTHYTYDKSFKGMFPFDESGQCNSGNTYYADLLRYCGIEAYVRNAQEYQSNHVLTAAILDNNVKYIIDATPNSYKMSTTDEALYYINGLIANTPDEWCRGYRVITWDNYSTHYSAFPGLSFYTND